MKANIIILSLITLIILPLFATGQPTTGHQLAVGDPAPHFNAYRWIKGSPMEDLRIGEVYLVEFGATWCAPCATAIPKLTALANKYRGRVTVVSTFVMEFNKNAPDKTPSYLDRVNSYIARRNEQIAYSVALDGPTRLLEKVWLEAAGLTGIPHSFLINTEGKIAWIGSNTEGLDNEIDKALVGSKITPETKSISKSATTDLFKADTLLYSSAFWKYRSGQVDNANNPFITSYQWAKPGSPESSKQGTVYVTGESLRRLYYMAYADTLWNYPLMMSPKTGIYPDTVQNPYQKRSYGKWWYRPILAIRDSSVFASNYREPGNRFNYLLKVPKELATARFIQKAMQLDLQTYFQYETVIEERMMPCWFLVTSKENQQKLMSKSAGQSRSVEDSSGNYHYFNGKISDIIFQLEIKYGYGPEGELVHHADRQPPFIDATGIKSQINYTITSDFAKQILEQYNGGKAFTFNDYQRMLQSVGIELVKRQKKMKVVVIRDRIL